MIKERTLNLAYGRGGVDVTSQRPVDWSAGRGAGTFNPESAAVGGSQFGYHRNHVRPTYVEDVIPTETGYQSVGWKGVCGCTKESKCPERLTLDTDCRDCQCLRSWNCEDFKDVTQGKNGTTYLKHDGTLYVPLGSSAGNHQPKGLDARCALGLVEFNSRLILYNEHNMYLESVTDAYQFRPSLEDQAQSFAVKYHIGTIVKLVHSGEYLYVLGTKGGAVGECTGDAYFPITFKHLENFEGITYAHNVDAQYHASSIYVWSKGSLGIIKRGGYQTIEADLSRLISRYTTVELGPDTGLDKLDVRSQDSYQVRDSLAYDRHSLLYAEARSDRYHNDVAVYTLTAGTYAVSYAREGSMWSRLLYVDTKLDRSSVLKVIHGAVLRTHMYEELLIATPSGTIQKLEREKGTGHLLFANNFRSSGTVIKIPRLNLHGQFDMDVYTTHSERYGAFENPKPPADRYGSIPFSTGTDVNSTNNTRELVRTYTDPHTLQYTGMILGNYVSMLIPFSGFLNTIKAQRA